MPLIRYAASILLLPGLLLLASCATEPTANRYQLEVSKAPPVAPVTQLQQQARAALERGEFQLAIDTLQRAIRIEPRDGWNWHYLAESYWRSGDYQQCRAMVERAFSYAGRDDRLLRENRKLQQKCSYG